MCFTFNSAQFVHAGLLLKQEHMDLKATSTRVSNGTKMFSFQ